jgi:SAM-dependent methyltransferase
VGAVSIVDLGCGTGLITRDLARRGYRVTGIDPAPAMIEVARRRPYGDRVHWIVGDASRAAALDADLAIMSGHVAQFFLTDEEWHVTLTALHAALRPDGKVALESRNPDAREWEDWTAEARRSVNDPTAGRVDTWSEVQDVGDGIVSYSTHYAFAATGETVVSPIKLRFRSKEELTQSLVRAGFTVERVYGDWARRPATATTPELICVAALRHARTRYWR